MKIEELIESHLGTYNLDVRVSKERFMDQKCTPDVVCIIADCVLNIRSSQPNLEFTVKDIWNSSYFITNVKEIFSKPSAKNPTTRSEYDKFIQQPLRLLSSAKVLTHTKRGHSNYYSIKNIDLLDYISLKDRNAYHFLYHYFIKVLADSNIIKLFEKYRDKYFNGSIQQSDYIELKHRFQLFIKGNTLINGDTEINRIFPKLLNVYAVKHNIPGSTKGKMSDSPFLYTDLMYNRKNWRDLKKNKQTSRQEALINNISTQQDLVAINKYLVQKAISNIKKWHSESEVKDQYANAPATQVHHIFPSALFPMLAHYVENLIRLTPTQHYTMAHRDNKTNEICPDYQLVCLLSKSRSIEESIKIFGERYYKKSQFVYVINEGLNAKLPFNNTFDDIRTALAKIYNDL